MPARVEGKTKIVTPILAAHSRAKKDITAGNGALHDVLKDKDVIATETTTNVFELLNYCGKSTAFIARDSPNSFVGYYCKMIPIEVVVRREAHGSYLKRSLSHKRGERFEKLVVEFYLKTKGKTFKGHALPCDDPLMLIGKERVFLFEPDKLIVNAFLTLPIEEVFEGIDTPHALTEEIAAQAVDAFVVLETAWKAMSLWFVQYLLADMKLEFGLYYSPAPEEELYGDQPRLMIADVIDNDSWRVLRNGRYIDKQVYRDGGAVDIVLRNYRMVAQLTSFFKDKRDRIARRARGAPDGYIRTYSCAA